MNAAQSQGYTIPFIIFHDVIPCYQPPSFSSYDMCHDRWPITINKMIPNLLHIHTQEVRDNIQLQMTSFAPSEFSNLIDLESDDDWALWLILGGLCCRNRLCRRGTQIRYREWDRRHSSTSWDWSLLGNKLFWKYCFDFYDYIRLGCHCRLMPLIFYPRYLRTSRHGRRYPILD